MSNKQSQAPHVFQLKELAQSITKNYKQLGVEIALGQTQEMLARTAGMSNWATVLAMRGVPAPAAQEARGAAAASEAASEEPMAWSYELSTCVLPDGSAGGWTKHLTPHKPCVPEGTIRNLVALSPMSAPKAAPMRLEGDDGAPAMVATIQKVERENEITDSLTLVCSASIKGVFDIGLSRDEIEGLRASELRMILAENLLDWARVVAEGGMESLAECIESCSLIEARDDDGKGLLWTPPEPEAVPEAEPKLRPVCKKCGSHLESTGYCDDSTCAYSDWPQNVAWGDMKCFSAEELEDRYGIKKRTRVSGECHSDDRVFEVEIRDVAPWLAQAGAEEIIDLANEGWGRCMEADSMVQFFSASNQDVSEMLGYVVRKDGVGYEGVIDGPQAMLWLKHNRPGVWARILCDSSCVHLEQAQEEEVRGMWGWIGKGEACARSFDTIEEAAMNAVLVLGLETSYDPD